MKKSDLIKHQLVCEQSKRTLNAILREHIFVELDPVIREDLHDGKATYRFSFKEVK